MEKYRLKKEFIVERQGRSFVLYSGLLDMAHQQGLKSIRTELIQIPTESCNYVAISTAIVTLEVEGQERTFTGIGDASPNNVAPAMQTCLIRMSETRAKARALRDAVNVGVAAFEELGVEDAHDGAPERGYPVTPPRAPRPEPRMPAASGKSAAPRNESAPRPHEAEKAEKGEGTPIPPEMQNPAANLITEAQMEAVHNLCRRRGLEAEAVARARFEVNELALLTQAQAGELIRFLNDRNGSAAR